MSPLAREFRHLLLASCLVASSGVGLADSPSGTFEGRSNHVTTGAVAVVEAENGVFIRLADDFSLDGAPDPIVGLGLDGNFAAETKAGSLRQLSGAQDYLLPAETDISLYNEVYIWCEQFAVPLGVAHLK